MQITKKGLFQQWRQSLKNLVGQKYFKKHNIRISEKMAYRGEESGQ